MPSQKVLWIALPNGISRPPAEPGLRVTVFVSPRLDPQDAPHRLESFPDLMNWPQYLKGLRFQVEAGGTAVGAAVRTSADPDPSEYAHIFRHDTYVRPYVFKNYDARAIRSFPVRKVAAYLQQAYAAVGADSPRELPRLPFVHGADLTLVDQIGRASCRERV